MFNKIFVLSLSLLITTPVFASMTFQEAKEYNKANNAKLHPMTIKIDAGNNSYDKVNILNIVTTMGAWHHFQQKDHTLLNPRFYFGTNDKPHDAKYIIDWELGLSNEEEGQLTPQNFYFNFVNGETYILPLEGFSPQTGMGEHFSRRKFLKGSITLKEFQIDDLCKLGQISTISIDYGKNKGPGRLFVYASDKVFQQRITASFIHAKRIMNMDEDIIKTQREDFEKERLAKLRKEIEEEINLNQERERIRQEILAEMKCK